MSRYSFNNIIIYVLVFFLDQNSGITIQRNPTNPASVSCTSTDINNGTCSVSVSCTGGLSCNDQLEINCLSGYDCFIDCNGDYSCLNTIINCAVNQTCTVDGDGFSAIKGSTINGDKTYVLDVSCSNNARWCTHSSTIHASDANTVIMNMESTESLYRTTIYVINSTDINVICDHDECFEESTLYGNNAMNFHFTCLGNRCLYRSKIFIDNTHHSNVICHGRSCLTGTDISVINANQFDFKCSDYLCGNALTIIGDGTDTLNFICTNSAQYCFVSAQLSASNPGDVFVLCESNNCLESASIKVNNPRSLLVQIEGDNALSNTNIECILSDNSCTSDTYPCVISINGTYDTVISDGNTITVNRKNDLRYLYTGNISTIDENYILNNIQIVIPQSMDQWIESNNNDTSSICTSSDPTNNPTLKPTNLPTISPTNNPTKLPTHLPTNNPTTTPTVSPTTAPTNSPVVSPTISPTSNPTKSPTHLPTNTPTISPTISPSTAPIHLSTNTPTRNPTNIQTVSPTRQRKIKRKNKRKKN